MALKSQLERATQLTQSSRRYRTGFGAGGKVCLAETRRFACACRHRDGLLVITMVFVTDWRIAIVLLIVIGQWGVTSLCDECAVASTGPSADGGSHSIAVQNFNENLSILMLLGRLCADDQSRCRTKVIIHRFRSVHRGSLGYLTRKHWQRSGPKLEAPSTHLTPALSPLKGRRG